MLLSITVVENFSVRVLMVHNVFAVALLYVGDTILLIQRSAHVDFGKGLYSLVGGKVEQGERALQAIKREVYEETGLDIPESDFEFVHALYRKGTETDFVAFCFKADISRLPAPYIKEPDKHDDMQFFTMDQVPNAMLSAHKQVLECIARSVYYSEHGW